MASFNELRQAAIDAQESGNYRLMADKAKEAVQSANEKKWFPGRYEFFHIYTTSFGQEHYNNMMPNDSDWDFLDKLSKDESEPILFRAEAALAFASIKEKIGDLEEAAEKYRETLDMNDKASDEEKGRTARTWNRGGIVEKPVATVLQEIQSSAEAMLAELETYPIAIPGASFVQDRLVVGGSKCDCCKKKRNDVDGGLLRCSRCKLAYYCTPVCQERQWRKGHKKCCRKPDDFRVGDAVRVRGLISRPDLNKMAGSILASAPDGRWEVELPTPRSFSGTYSVASKNLSHVRPAM